MVVIPGKIYKKIGDDIDNIDDMIENYEIYEQIKERISSKKSDFIEGDDMLKKLNVSL